MPGKIATSHGGCKRCKHWGELVNPKYIGRPCMILSEINMGGILENGCDPDGLMCDPELPQVITGPEFECIHFEEEES